MFSAFKICTYIFFANPYTSGNIPYNIQYFTKYSYVSKRDASKSNIILILSCKITKKITSN